MQKTVGSSQSPVKGTEVAVRIRRPKMFSCWGVEDVIHGWDKTEVTTEPQPASAEAKGMPDYTK